MSNRAGDLGDRLRQIASSRGLSLGAIMCNIAADYIVGASRFLEALEDPEIQGSSVDLALGTGTCFAIQTVGSVSGTTPQMVGKMQESHDNATWVDIAGATFAAVTSSNNLQVINFTRSRRYVRHFATITGASPVINTSVLVGQKRA